MVKRQRSPAEKKALAYEKDHINAGVFPHTFRRAWSRKEARAQRAYRRKIHTLLNNVAQHPADNDVKDPEFDGIRRRQVRKSYQQLALGLWVESRFRERAYRALSHFFSTPYNKNLHQAPFAAFLAEQVGRDTPYAREIAGYLRAIQEWAETGHVRRPIMPWTTPTWGRWLAAFLADEPEWEPKLWAWIADLSSHTR